MVQLNLSFNGYLLHIRFLICTCISVGDFVSKDSLVRFVDRIT
jgi:hypothetical protein